MKLCEIKNFIDYLIALEAFDVDTNVYFELDKTGDVDKTQINVNFRYPLDLNPDDTIKPTEEEVGVAQPTDDEMLDAAFGTLFSTLKPKQCCKEKECCSDKCDKIKTGFHAFPGGFALHSVSCKGKPEEEEEEEAQALSEREMLDEIMREFPKMLDRFKKS